MKILAALCFGVGGIAVVALGGIFGHDTAFNTDDFLRLHIRAHSNSHSDQLVKYEVKQAILDEFTPVFAFVTSREQAMTVLHNNLRRFEQIADDVLSRGGKTYTSSVTLRSEFFPERSYNGHVLPSGMYDALVITLGAGLGDNWWCVVYPPLCFLDNNIGGERGVIYRSRLQEIIRRHF